MDDNENDPRRVPHHVGDQSLDLNQPLITSDFTNFSHDDYSASLHRPVNIDAAHIGVTPPGFGEESPYLVDESNDPRLFDQDYLGDSEDYSNFSDINPLLTPVGLSPGRSSIHPLGLFSSPPTGEKFSELPLFISQQKRGPGRPRKDGQSPIPRKVGIRPRGGRRGRPASYQSLTFRQAFTAPVMSSAIQPDLMDSGSCSNLGSSSSHSPFSGETTGFDLPGVLSESVGAVAEMEEELQGPIHICAFCACGEKSLLGQGRIIQFEPTDGYDVFANILPKANRSVLEYDEKGREKSPKQHLTWRRMRGPPKGCRERSRSPRQLSLGGEDDPNSCHVIDELSQVGFTEDVELGHVFEPTGHVWAHQCCARWSLGVRRNEDAGSLSLGVRRGDDGTSLLFIDKAVFDGLTRKCNYCNRYGASLLCRDDECSLFYHYPCAAAGGSYQDYSSLSLWCPLHLQHAQTIESAICVLCSSVGNVAEQLFCTSCGMHYHGTCLCPAVEVKAIVRAGWQCPNCKICQTCRHPGDDSKMLVCDTCDKGYHTFCLKPAMTTIPKNGWKCKNCRVCSDCGARTPGNGPSSRWHLNYSVCDSCYQQRNKGLCCPLCGKAYRHFHNKTMVPCNKCKKYVHSECDLSIDATILQKLKDGRPTEYVCSVCIEQEQEQQMDLGPFTLPEEESLEAFPPLKESETLIKEDSFLNESLLTASSQESIYDEDSSMDFDFSLIDQGLPPAITSNHPTPPQGGKGHGGKGKLIDRGKLGVAGKKKFGSGRPRGRPFSEKRRRDPIQYGDKRRGPKVKIKLGGGTPTSQIISTGSSKDDKSDDSGDDHPSTIMLCNSKDPFSLDQDVCKSCGSFGTEEDGKLIGCTQCGQCYHPYCARVKVTKVILMKGWRCLDCTVCEGCGKPDDEGRLLLCDDCDISYHTYCLKPPLEHVPKGNWKCKWCVNCLNCGSTTPGFGCNWKNNYTQCGPCASKVNCAACRRSYQQEEIIIQCVQCDRWLHAACDGLKNEDEAELAADYGYHCLFCRPKTGQPGPLPPPPPPPPPEPKEIKPPTPPPIPREPEPPKQYLVDGVYLFASGMQQLENLALHMPRKPIQRRNRMKKSDPETHIRHPNVARLLSMSSQEGDDDKEGDELLEGQDQSSLLSPPVLPPGQNPMAGAMATIAAEGFNKDGTKKRQRRQIGVGGFIVRQRSRMTSYKRQMSASMEVTDDHQPFQVDEGSVEGQDGVFKRQRKKRVSKKSKLEEKFPAYLQEAFFGREVLDHVKENKETLAETETDHDKFRVMSPYPLLLEGPSINQGGNIGARSQHETHSQASTEHGDDIHNLDAGDFKDILPDFQHDEDILHILDEGQDLDITNSMDSVDNKTDGGDNLDNLLDPHLDEKNLDVDRILSEGLIQIDPKAVQSIFGGGHEGNRPQPGPGQYNLPGPSGLQPHTTGLPVPSGLGQSGMVKNLDGGPLPELHPASIPGSMIKLTGMGQSLSSVGHNQPPGMPSQSPFPNHGMGSDPLGARQVSTPPGMSPDALQNIPQLGFPQNFIPQQMTGGSYGNDPNMWGLDDGEGSSLGSSRRNILKWEADEKLGENATISSILFVNTNYPTLIQEYPEWPERAKQIAKLWRKLSHDQKAPYLAQARKNRTSSRVQKAQRQVTQELKRRQEAQLRHDSEVMPPPPAPPPLHSPGQQMGLEHFMHPPPPGGHPNMPPQQAMMSPRPDLPGPLSPNRQVMPGISPADGQSPLHSPLHSPGAMNLPPIWGDEQKPVGPSESQPSPGGLQRQNSDPYAFPPPSPTCGPPTRPLNHPPRMPPPGYHQGGLPRHASTESDPYARHPPTPRPDGAAGPRMPPPSPDPYSFNPGTPHPPTPTEDSYNPGPPRSAADTSRSLPPDLAGISATLLEVQPPMTPKTSQAGDPFSQPMTPRPVDSSGDPLYRTVRSPSTGSTDPFSQTPRSTQDPYGHAPGTPRPASTPDHFNQAGPPPPEGFMHPQLSPRQDPYAQAPMTPRSSVGMGSPMHSPTSRAPGPLRHPDPSQIQGPPGQFRHPLVRSQSQPDPYSHQPGTPHPGMGSPMSRPVSVGGSEGGMPQYRPVGRPGVNYPESAMLQQLIDRRESYYPGGGWPLSHNHYLVGMEGMDMDRVTPGATTPQQLREILAHQTKKRQMRKQLEDREKMMHMPGAPPVGWTPDGSPRHPGMPRMPGYGMGPERGPRPPFTEGSTMTLQHEQWPVGQRLVRPPQPGQFTPDGEGFHPRTPGQFGDGVRQGFPPGMRMRPPGPGGMPPRPFPSPDGSNPGLPGFTRPASPQITMSQEMIAERRAQYLQMRQKAQQAGQLPPGLPGPQPQGEVFRPPGPPPAQGPGLPSFPPTSEGTTSDDDVFRPAGAGAMISNPVLKSAAPVTPVVPPEGEINLPDIDPKVSKPSQSSEDDKHELIDDDLLSADGTFDILRFTDPELDKILGEEESNLLDENLDFMDEQKPPNRDEPREEDEPKTEVKEEEKKPAETEETSTVKTEEDKTESKDFQSKFLEFSQKRKDGEDVKAGTSKSSDKSKGPVGVSHIAALLQGTKPVENRMDKAEAEKQEIQNLAGTVEALRKDMEARRQEASKQDMIGQRPHFGPGMASPLHHVASPHQSPSIGIPLSNPDASGLHSPKVLPRSGQPSPRTPGMHSPFGPMLGPVLSPMSQPMNPEQQLSPFPAGSAHSPFSPPVSSCPLSPFASTTSGPHSPFPQIGPNVSQPQFGHPGPGQVPYGSPSHSVSQPATPGQTFPMQHASRATITPTNQYTQGTYGQPYMPPRGGTLTPSPNSILYGQSAAAQHAMRTPGPGMRSPFPGMDPSQDPRMAFSHIQGNVSQTQPQMTSPTLDSRPQHMIQKIQQGLMEMGKGPTSPGGMPPSSQAQGFYRPERPHMGQAALQQQLAAQGMRPMMHMRPGSPRFNAGQRLPPPGMRMQGPHQATPGSPGFPGPVGPRPRSSPPGFTGGPRPGMFPPGATQPQTLLDELVEEEKKEQKRQAEQQAIARRDIPGTPEGMMAGMPRPGMQPGLPGMAIRMEQRMPGPDPNIQQPIDMMAQQFSQFPVRPPVSQLSPRTPSPFGGQSPGIQQTPINPMAMLPPQPPVTPPSGDMPGELDPKRIPYEDWLLKQGQFLEMQVKLFEQQTQKQKRAKRSIQARQRQARKIGNELNPQDVLELERISTEQSGLQKQLDSYRKQLRNHQSLLQDYRDKQKEQFGRNWQPNFPTPIASPQMAPPAQGQMSPGGRISATPRMPTPSRFQGPRPNQPGRAPRGPGNNSVRMSPSARQEYEVYMQSRLRMANPAVPNPSIPAIPKPPAAMTVVGDNNPFSEAFQEREHMEKLQINIGEPSTVPEIIRPFDPTQQQPHGQAQPPPPPPYPEPGTMYPRIPGAQIGDPRFQGFNPMHPGFGIPPATLTPEMGATQGKEKTKKRRKKRKADDLENAQSQPLPPSLPNQAALLGHMGNQPGSTPTTSKPEFPVKPHSETERRILEILSNTAALAQQKSSASQGEAASAPTMSTAGQPATSTSPASSQGPHSTITQIPSKQPQQPPASSSGPVLTSSSVLQASVQSGPHTTIAQAHSGTAPGFQHNKGPGGPMAHPNYRPGAPLNVIQGNHPQFNPRHPHLGQMVPSPHPIAQGPHTNLGPRIPGSNVNVRQGIPVSESEADMKSSQPQLDSHQQNLEPSSEQLCQGSQDQIKPKSSEGQPTSSQLTPPVTTLSSSTTQLSSTSVSVSTSQSPLTENVQTPSSSVPTEATSAKSGETLKDSTTESSDQHQTQVVPSSTPSSIEATGSVTPQDLPKKKECIDGHGCGTDDEDDNDGIEDKNDQPSEQGQETSENTVNPTAVDPTTVQESTLTPLEEEKIFKDVTESKEVGESSGGAEVASKTIKEEIGSADVSLEMDESHATVVTGTLQNVTLSASEELPLPQPCIISTSSAPVSCGEIINVTTSANQITVQTVIETHASTTVSEDTTSISTLTPQQPEDASSRPTATTEDLKQKTADGLKDTPTEGVKEIPAEATVKIEPMDESQVSEPKKEFEESQKKDKQEGTAANSEIVATSLKPIKPDPDSKPPETNNQAEKDITSEPVNSTATTLTKEEAEIHPASSQSSTLSSQVTSDITVSKIASSPSSTPLTSSVTSTPSPVVTSATVMSSQSFQVDSGTEATTTIQSTPSTSQTSVVSSVESTKPVLASQTITQPAMPQGPPPPYPHTSVHLGAPPQFPPGSVSNQLMTQRPGVPTSAHPGNPPTRHNMPPGMDPALGPRTNPRMFPRGMDPRMMRMRFDPRMMRPGQDPSQFRHGFDPRMMRPGVLPPGIDLRQFRPRMVHGFDQTMMRPGMEQRMMMRPSQTQGQGQDPDCQERYQLRNPMDPQQMQFRHPNMDPNMIRMMHNQSSGKPMGMGQQRPMMNMDLATSHHQHPIVSSEMATSVPQSMPGQIRQPYPSPRASGPHQMNNIPSNMSDLHRQMLAQQDAASQKHPMSSAAHNFNPGHPGISTRPPLSHSVSMPPYSQGMVAGPHTSMAYHHPGASTASQLSPTVGSVAYQHGPQPPPLSHQLTNTFASMPLHPSTSPAVSNLEQFVSSANMPSAIINQTSSSCASTPSPHLTSPASSTPPSCINIKQEPGLAEELRAAEAGGEEMDGEQRSTQNVLLKQLLATSSGHNLSQMVARSETPNSQGTDEALPELTPEQQRQLQMIEEMPLCKEAERSMEDWADKTAAEQDTLMEKRKQEYEQKRREYEEMRKAKKKVGQPNETKPKRRKKLEGNMDMPGVVKKRRKSKLSKEVKVGVGPEHEIESVVDTFLLQLRSMAPVQLQEPVLETSFNIVPIKGAALSKDSMLTGVYGRGVLENVPDYYGHFILSQMSPQSLRTLPVLEKTSRRRYLGELESSIPEGVLEQQRYQLMPDKPFSHSALIAHGLTKNQLELPPHPRIDSRLADIKSDSPDTVISSSSPEFGFGEQDSDYPALRPIEPAALSIDGKTSPFVPLIHPIPIKSEPGIKLEDKSDEVKEEAEQQIDPKVENSVALTQVSPGLTKGDEMITTKLPITSGLVSPFTDPNTDQQVSVTLTLSASAAEDIGGVIAGIADLLQIAIPPTYEVRRTPSPESYKVQMTHKEQALSIHSLVKAKPKFCRHCDVVVISSGIIKKKADLPVLTKEEQESEGDDVTFCSMNCYMQFSITHQSNQTMETKESGNIVEHKSVESTPTASPRNTLSALSINTTPPSGSSGHTQPTTPTTPLLTPNITLPKDSPSPNTLSPQIKPKLEEKMNRKLKRTSSISSEPPKPLVKKWKDIRWKYWDLESAECLIKVKKHSTVEIDELWAKLVLAYKPDPMPEDTRVCAFCGLVGDGQPDGPSRLLNLDVDKWAHLNCSLWSSEVYETLNGALMSVDIAYKRGLTVECSRCRKPGATMSCFKVRCANSYHLPCAQNVGCMFFQDKTILCPNHLPKGHVEDELTSLVVSRRVYINRDDDRQIASMIHQEEGNHTLRVGSLTLHCIGQLLPHQIQTNNFNTREYIYPVGFRTSRFYWSMRALYKRCRYTCYIQDKDGRPEFVIKITESGFDDVIIKDSNPKGAWMNVFEPIEKMKRKNDLVKLYPSFVTGEEMFGLTETNIVKVLESLPGTDLLKDYSFKFGRSPLIEMPLAINPTGSARTEPKLRTHFRRPHALQTSSSTRSLPSSVTGVTGDVNSPYMKQFVHSKSQQYRRLKTEWKTNVYLDRSRIQGLGLYAARDLEKHTMVIEYIGDLIRNEVANRREKTYEEQNRGIYMFRIDEDSVIDATMAGGPARYINHSCAPNCVAEVVPFEKDSKIIIITNRRLSKGEELTYDYKFDFEDDQHKIPCSCGAGCCRKWMN
ncbi:hypothetical protein SNE40_011007 [Patella caerulea]|uniref:[Histone H3]-lysine(4) N-trimethyltransferase n=1 Tax=Patella caerulea TaxID=87958 RepID=A0AAN8JX38_PATCE